MTKVTAQARHKQSLFKIPRNIRSPSDGERVLRGILNKDPCLSLVTSTPPSIIILINPLFLGYGQLGLSRSHLCSAY